LFGNALHRRKLPIPLINLLSRNLVKAYLIEVFLIKDY